MANNIPNAFAQWLISKDSRLFGRLKTQGITLGQQLIADGFGFETNWIESNIASDSSRYAAFNIPDDHYMILSKRVINPSAENFLYRAYPSGTYTLGAAKVNDDSNFSSTINFRQDSLNVRDPLVRHNVLSEPNSSDSIVYEPIWGSGSGAGTQSGYYDKDDLYLIFSPSQQFLLQITNNGNGTASCQVKVEFALLPASLLSPAVV